MFDMNKNIEDWRNHLLKHGGMTKDDVEELESHLADQVEELKEIGLTDEEAFIIGARRLGQGAALAKEYTKVNTDRLWKNLMDDDGEEYRQERLRRIVGVVILSAFSGLLARALVTLLGISPLSDNALQFWKYAGLIFIPCVGIYISLERKARSRDILRGSLYLIVFAVCGAVYPFGGQSVTGLLFALFSPVALWLMLTPLYSANLDRHSGSMNFVQFTGELFVYTALLYCGGMVLIFLTLIVFSSIGLSLENAVIQNLGIVGGFAAPVVSAYLVEQKKSVVENLAPILAKIFSPMFLILMTAFVIAMVVTGSSPFANREYLLGFEILLVLVLAMVMYVISARPIRKKPEIFDYLNSALIAVAIIVDVVVLGAVIYRTIQGSLTPNRLMVLGLNTIFLIHFGAILRNYLRYLFSKIAFGGVESQLTYFIPGYAVWSAIVALVLPPAFGWI